MIYILIALVLFTGSLAQAEVLEVGPAGGGVGTLDDIHVYPFTSIQAAIDYANPGDTIIVHEGTYPENITVNKSLTLVGAKQDVDPNGSTDRGGESVIDGGQVEITAAEVILNGFTISGNRIWIHGVADVTVSYNIVLNSTSHGIYIDTSSPGAQILYNTVSNPEWQGISNQGNSDVKISYNHVMGVDTQQPIESTNHTGTAIEITYNVISGCTSAKGINYWGGPGVVISYNQISDTTNEAIFSDTKTNTIVGNTLSDIGGPGIQLYPVEVANDGEKSIISENIITATKWQGITVFGQAYTEITGNTLTGCNYYGADGTGDWDYAGIHVEDLGGSSQYCLINNNTVTDGINGIQVWSSDCTITNNIVTNMGLTYADSKTVGDDTYWNSGIIIGAMPGIGVSPTGVVVQENTLTGNVVGLFVHHASNEAHFNLITGSTRYGVENAHTNTFNAENNWWGDAAGPYNPVSNPGSSGDEVSDNVDYDPWCTAPDCGASGIHPVVNITKGFSYSTIQGAIDEADAGDTIVAAAGTYNERVNIDKSLTLKGANAGIPATEARGPESIINPQGLGLDFGVLIDGVGTTATIDGFTVENYERAGILAGAFSLDNDPDVVHILNNIITEPIGQHNNNCIQVGDGTTGTVIGNEVIGANLESPDWSGSGILVAGSSDVLVSDNYVHDCEGGIQIAGYIEYHDAPAEDNLIENNILEDNETGISVQQKSVNTIVRYNEVMDNNEGIAVMAIDYSWEHSSPSGTEIRCNKISGNSDYGVLSSIWESDGIITSPEQVDARYNWWGDASGPSGEGGGTGDAVSESVDFFPWLLSIDGCEDYTLLAPDYVVDDDWAGLPDFTQVFVGSQDYYISLNAFDTIQGAVDAASDGNNISVAAGEYAGALIDEDLTIIGANPGGSVITSGVPYKDGSSLETAFRLDSGASGTEIKNFTIDCNSANSFFFAIFSRAADEVVVDSLTVNNPVQGITNYAGSSWQITNNLLNYTEASGGGGIAIYLGSYPPDYVVLQDNVVKGNSIISQAADPAYTCPGIALCLDLRYGRFDDLTGYEDISYNMIVDNDIVGTGLDNEVGIETGVIGLEGDPNKIEATLGLIHDNTIRNNIVENTDLGIYFYTVTDLRILGNEIVDCNDGIHVEDSHKGVVINFNSIYGNADYGVNNTGGVVVDASYNWWGDISGPNDPCGVSETDGVDCYSVETVKNADGLGNDVSDGNVIYCPWLLAPVSSSAYPLPVGDLNFDGCVNMVDLAMLAEHWLEGCE